MKTKTKTPRRSSRSIHRRVRELSLENERLRAALMAAASFRAWDSEEQRYYPFRESLAWAKAFPPKRKPDGLWQQTNHQVSHGRSPLAGPEG